MSKYEAELKRRLESEDDIENTACWYIRRVHSSRMEYADMTQFEIEFWARVVAAYLRWSATRPKH